MHLNLSFKFKFNFFSRIIYEINKSEIIEEKKVAKNDSIKAAFTENPFNDELDPFEAACTIKAKDKQ